MTESDIKKIVIIYYSRTGNTKAMAEFFKEGALTVEGVSAEVVDVEAFDCERLLDYDAIVLGSPTYYGSMAYQIKALLDESVRFHGQLAGRVGGAFSSAANIGGGNETTINDMLNALLIHGMVIQGSEQGDHYGPVSIGAPDDRAEKYCRATGKRIADLVKKVR